MKVEGSPRKRWTLEAADDAVLGAGRTTQLLERMGIKEEADIWRLAYEQLVWMRTRLQDSL